MKKFVLYSLSIISLCSSYAITATECLSDSEQANLVENEQNLRSIAALGEELFKKTINFLQLIETDKRNITIDMIDELDQLLADIVRFTKSLPEDNQSELLRHVNELKPILSTARKTLLS